MGKDRKKDGPSWSIIARDIFISSVENPNDAKLFRVNINILASVLDESGIRCWTDIFPDMLWRYFRDRPFWHYRGIESFFCFIGLERMAPFSNERNIKRIRLFCYKYG